MTAYKSFRTCFVLFFASFIVMMIMGSSVPAKAYPQYRYSARALPTNGRMGGVSSPPSLPQYRCFARALPTNGRMGGVGWAPTLMLAKDAALFNCRRFALEGGGNPNTCRVVASHCKP
jgi:hypothetical protein